MITQKPKTYNEIVRLKKCYAFTKQFANITEKMFNDMYDFLGQDPNNQVVTSNQMLLFLDSDNNIVRTYSVVPSK